MDKVFGPSVRNIRFFHFGTVDFNGTPLRVSRSGYSRQDGFEIYLEKSSLGLDLWDTLWEAGQNSMSPPDTPT